MSRLIGFCLLMFFAGTAYAQAGFDDSGFGDFGSGSDLTASTPELDLSGVDTTMTVKPWEFYGYARLKLGYSPFKKSPKKKLTEAQEYIKLNFDYKFSDQWKAKVSGYSYFDFAYRINGRSGYTQDTLAVYEQEAELKDTYIEGAFDNGLSIKTGRQVIAWGQSEGSQVNDMANPRNYRQLGLIDIENIRLPVGATKVSWAHAGYEMDLVAIHEFRPNKMPGRGSEFDFFGSRRSLVLLPEDRPRGQDGTLARLFKSFNGGEVSLYASDTYNDNFYLDLTRIQFGAGGVQMYMTPKYHKVKSFGLGGNRVFGSVLFKAEVAHKQGTVVNRIDLAAQIKKLLKQGVAPSALASHLVVHEQKDLTQAMAGFDYTGVSDLTVSFEVSTQTYQGGGQNLSPGFSAGTSFSSLDYAALNGTLHTRGVWLHLLNAQGDVLSVNVGYDLIDALNLSLGYIDYYSPKPSSLLAQYTKNNRVTGTLKYSF